MENAEKITLSSQKSTKRAIIQQKMTENSTKITKLHEEIEKITLSSQKSYIYSQILTKRYQKVPKTYIKVTKITKKYKIQQKVTKFH